MCTAHHAAHGDLGTLGDHLLRRIGQVRKRRPEHAEEPREAVAVHRLRVPGHVLAIVLGQKLGNGILVPAGHDLRIEPLCNGLVLVG
jgi:hypothetical protein